MGLPRELIDEIMRYHDPQTLKRCSLTSRAFYSAARPSIHRQLVLDIKSAVRGSDREILPFDRDAHLAQAEVYLARYLSVVEERGLLRHGYVREVRLDLCFGNPENVLQLQQVRVLETVHTLTIEGLDLPRFLPIFDRCFSQFVPTLRSLSLERTHHDKANQLMEFVGRFPHLEDLEFSYPSGPGYNPVLADAPLSSKGLRLQQSLPLGGHLVLDGAPFVQCLLDLIGDIHFRSIEVASSQKDLRKLLVACSSTLEDLSINCFESCRSATFNLHASPLKGHWPPVSFSPTTKASGT